MPSVEVRRVTSPILIGRDQELDALVELALAAPSLALIEGEAGAGKTRLVAELAADRRLGGAPVLIGRCTPLQEPFPLGPVVDALRQLTRLPSPDQMPCIVAAVRPLLPEIAERLPPRGPNSADPLVDRHILFRSLVALLECAGRAVLVLEDLHWVDEATLEFTRFLLAHPPPDLAVVLTYRREDLPSASPLREGFRPAAGSATARLTLAPLRSAEVRHQIEAILGTSVSAQLATAMYERSGGLPFAVEELVCQAASAGLFGGGPGTDAGARLDSLGAPAAVRDLVLDRVATLPADSRQLIRAAAVLDEPASQRLLARVGGVPLTRAGPALAGARKAAVLVELEPGRYGFRHALAALAVLGDVAQPERRRMHGRAAVLLEQRQPAPYARLVHHFREAGRNGRWIEWAEEAADAAVAGGDPDAAVGFLSDVLQHQRPNPAVTARLADKLGRAALMASTAGQRGAIELLSRTVAHPGLQPAIRESVRRWLAHLLTWSGDADAGYAELVRCLDEPKSDPAVAVRMMADLALAPNLSMDVRQRDMWMERAALAAAELEDPDTALAVQAARANLLLIRGDRRAWQTVRTPEVAHLSPQPPAHLQWTWLRWATSCLHLGHYARAEELLDRMIQVDCALAPSVASCRETCGLVLAWAMGEWDGLRARASAHSWLTRHSAAASIPSAHISGFLALVGGDVECAEEQLSECAGRAKAAGLARSYAAATSGLVRVRLRRGEPEAAALLATSALDELTNSGMWLWTAELMCAAVDALVATGRRHEGHELVAFFAGDLTGRDAPLGRAVLAAGRGSLFEASGDPARAARAFDRAERRFAGLPRPYDAALAAARRARCRVAAGQDSDIALTAACTRLAALGAVADAQEFGHTVRRRGGRPSYGEQLSPREEQVAELAAAGLTNAKIAERLGLSCRTVDHHVAAVVRKLHLSSKKALVPLRFSG